MLQLSTNKMWIKILALGKIEHTCLRTGSTLEESNIANLFFLAPLAPQIQLRESSCFHRFESLPEHQVLCLLH